MKLLIVNPNISTSVTALIEAEARRTAAPDTHIAMATAAFGVAYIETRFEALVGGYATACIAGEQAGSYDAIIVAAFGDPGLAALKEAVGVPVVGMTEAALASACLLGQRFSIIAISRRITAWYRETVAANGLLDRLASIRHLDQPLHNVGTIQEDHGERLRALCQSAVEEDHADVIIVAGAPLAGLARGIAHQLPVPVVDGVSSAVRHAETLVALGTHRATRGSGALPPDKPRSNLPAGIERLLAQPRD
ncbi:MAG: aspartate/glutamate racemase family protein [Rhodocyclaceae bacterium]